MAPGRRRGSGRAAAAAAAAAAQQQLKVGDLVLAKMKGFPAWPAEITEPEKWGFSSVRKKLLVFFYGTKQIAFCNYADIEPFTEEKKKTLLLKRQGKGADFVRAVEEIIEVYENMKKQSLDIVISGEQVNEMELDNLDSSKGDSSRKSPEPDSVNATYKSKDEKNLKTNDDIPNLEVGSGTPTEIDLQKKEVIYKEPIEKVSILDHLRLNTITAGTSSRKRKLRDNPSQDSQKNTESLLKSTSSSSADALYKMDFAIEENQVKSVDKINAGGDTLVVSVNKSLEDHGEETNERHSDHTKINEENLPPSCKEEVSTNGHVDGSVKLNGKLELPTEGLVFRKKRKPIRKRMNNAVECTAMNKEANSQVELTDTVLESSNSDNVAYEISIKSDGDEHLPLVKRARVRMGQTSGDEAQPTSVDIDNKCEVDVNVNSIDISCRTLILGSDSSPSLACKEELSTSAENNPALPSPRDISFWKAKKYQIKGFDMDVEAALPPSKRLHRALEAMSANVAETKESCPETLDTTESNGLISSNKSSSPKFSSEERVGFAAKCLQSNDNNGLITDVSESLPHSTKLALPSEAKPNHNSSTPSPSNEKCIENLDTSASFIEKSVSDAPVDDFQKSTLQSCSSNFTEDINVISAKGLSDNLYSADLVNKKECPGVLVEEENVGDDMKPFLDRSNSVLKPALKGSELKPALRVNVDNSVVPPDEASSRASADKPTSFPLDDDSQTRYMQDVSKEAIRLTPSDKCYSPELTPMKELIAAAQARRFLSRSASLADNHIQRTALSPSAVQKDFPSRHFSPPVIISHKLATDDRLFAFQNSGRSPQLGHRSKDLSRSFSRAEANAAHKAFEAFLCTLTRTKDSIGRATRLAIDCAKYGIAGEVIDIIVHNLEKETNLHRRLDLFFLVDSITKGGAGDVYCSLVQAVLPRLLSFAAPRGSAAYENRRQCLKVLRLWLERKALPESVIRHHIRELEMLNETTFPGGSSRRPLRTERAFNDPVREMEGMLVDEYGSNTSMQLPSLLGTNVLEDEDGSTSEENSFEAVTPERHNDLDQETGEVQLSSLKHRHVLEDIDGELEMEDVAPHEVEVGSSGKLLVDDTLTNTQNQNGEQQLRSFGPPLPEDRPPSPPPLPSSPPPFAPPSSTSQSALPHQQSTPDAVPDPSNLHASVFNNNSRVRQPEPISQQPTVPNSCLAPPESMPYYAPGYAGPKPMPPLVSVCTTPGAFGNLPPAHLDLHSRDNCVPIVSSSLNSRPYHLPPPPPPPPTVSNQFSYIHAEAQRGQPWRNGSTFQDRFSYMPDNQRGNFFSDRATNGTYHHEVPDGSRFPYPGSLHPEKVEGSSAPPLMQYGPPREALPSHGGWSIPPRFSNYSGFTSRPPLESPTSRAAGAPGYWRPR